MFLFRNCVQNGNTALMEASESGHTAVVKVLVENGADVEEKNKVGVFIKSSKIFYKITTNIYKSSE